MTIKNDSLFFSSGQITFDDRDDVPNTLGEDETFEVEWLIFREGKFKHPWYGDLTFDTQYLESIVANHKKNILQRKVGFDAAHKPSNGAISWIEDQESGLYLKQKTFDTNLGPKTRVFLAARHELNSRGVNLVNDKIYRYFSSEIDPNYSTGEVETVDTEDGEAETVLEFGPTLIGGGIVMRPYIPNLGAVSFSEGDESLHEKIKDEVTIFKSEDGEESGVFMFKDALPDIYEKNKSNKYYQFSKPDKILGVESEETEEDEGDDKGTEQEIGEGDIQNRSEDSSPEKFNKENIKGEQRMKFTEVLNHISGMDGDKAKLEYLETVKVKFNDSEESQVFNEFLNAKREAVEAKEEAEDAIQRKSTLEQQYEEAKAERIKLQNDLREAREGSRKAQVQQFSAELREQGYTEALVKEVEKILSGLPSETFSQSFSIKGGTEDEDINLTFKEMFSRVFSKLPDAARPVTNGSKLESNQDNQVDGEGAKAGETQVDPDAGAQDFDEPEAEGDEDPDVPEGVVKFAEKHGYVPEEHLWGNIDSEGMLNSKKVEQE